MDFGQNEVMRKAVIFRNLKWYLLNTVCFDSGIIHSAQRPKWIEWTLREISSRPNTFAGTSVYQNKTP